MISLFGGVVLLILCTCFTAYFALILHRQNDLRNVLAAIAGLAVYVLIYIAGFMLFLDGLKSVQF